MNNLGTLGGTVGFGNGINDNGQIVGYSYLAGNQTDHAFLYSGGVLTDLGLSFGGTRSRAHGINNNGQIVGMATTAGNATFHAFLYSSGVLSDLGTLPGGNNSFASSINNDGKVVGYSYVTGNSAYHAFLYNGGSMLDLGTLGGSASVADAINIKGQIVGWAQTSFAAGGSQDAFLYSGGVMKDLNSLIPGNSGWKLVEATAINDNGQIVGYGTNPAGQTDAFLLTVPEPSITALVALGGLGFLLRRRFLKGNVCIALDDVLVSRLNRVASQERSG
jgi:probable HAF family extracellular repeat protein